MLAPRYKKPSHTLASPTALYKPSKMASSTAKHARQGRLRSCGSGGTAPAPGCATAHAQGLYPQPSPQPVTAGIHAGSFGVLTPYAHLHSCKQLAHLANQVPAAYLPGLCPPSSPFRLPVKGARGRAIPLGASLNACATVLILSKPHESLKNTKE